MSGAVLLGLSKAFDNITRKLLIAKLNAYRFDKEALKLYSYLKGKKQSALINNIYSNFLESLIAFVQSSILGVLRFNAFPNDLFLFLFIYKYFVLDTLETKF